MKSHLPLPEANLLAPVYYGRGPPIHNFVQRAVGPWGHPESEQRRRTSPPRSSQSLRSTWSVSLSVRLVPSTIPELWGLYAVCNFHLMFKVLLTCYTKSAMKAGPLSDPVLDRKSKSGNYLPKQALATFDALLVRVGKASTHPENVHTTTSR